LDTSQDKDASFLVNATRRKILQMASATETKYTKIERGTDCDETSGVVVLGRTKINIPEDLNDSVASAPLISAVENVFNLFIEEDVKGLARISGMRS
jgi:hypothetical protein